MKANNTGNAWAIKEYTLETEADTRRYEIEDADFGKPLLIATVPSSTPGIVEPEQTLEFTQLEQLPNDWAYLSNNSYWSLWLWGTSQKARYAAFYRQLDATGFKNYLEIRPTPAADEEYRVLYQVGDWSASVTSDLNFAFPFPELDFYFVTLVSDCLLYKCRWADGKDQKAELEAAFGKDLSRYQRTFDDYIASLTVTDIVYAESFADHCGF